MLLRMIGQKCLATGLDAFLSSSSVTEGCVKLFAVAVQENAHTEAYPGLGVYLITSCRE